MKYVLKNFTTIETLLQKLYLYLLKFWYSEWLNNLHITQFPLAILARIREKFAPFETFWGKSASLIMKMLKNLKFGTYWLSPTVCRDPAVQALQFLETIYTKDTNQKAQEQRENERSSFIAIAHRPANPNLVGSSWICRIFTILLDLQEFAGSLRFSLILI